jgi:hypothetical protein
VSTTTNRYLQPALFGGLVMGVLSALPIIYFGNVCCCLWVISGGVVAAYVLQQNQATPITAGDGALVGLLAGLIGAAVQFVLSIPIDIIMAPLERNMAQRFIDMAGNPEVRDIFEQVTQRRLEGGILFLVITRMIMFMVMLFIGAIFSTIGGLIGQAIFQKKLPPGTIDVTPPPA